MKTKFFILKQESEKVSEKTLTSIRQQYDEESIQIVDIANNNEAYTLNACVFTLKEEYTHFCLVPNGSELTNKFKAITDTYIEEGAIMLPIVEWCEEDSEGQDAFKAFLNSYVYQSALTEEMGTVDLKFAKQQLDNTLYGALIPVSVAKENKFKEKFLYYNHNEYLCRVASKGVEILGVQKYCFKLKVDYALKDVDNETKTKYFNAVLSSYELEDIAI